MTARHESDQTGTATHGALHGWMRTGSPSRDELVAAGVLWEVPIDVSLLAHFLCFVNVTATVYDDCITFTTEEAVRCHLNEIESFRLLRVVEAARVATLKAGPSCSTVPFEIVRVPRDGRCTTREPVRLVAHVERDGAAERFVTIAMPGEM